MSINYDQYLSVEQKKSILNQRILQFAAEAYQHQIQRTVVEEFGTEEALEQVDSALQQLKRAIAVHEEELSSLPEE